MAKKIRKATKTEAVVETTPVGQTEEVVETPTAPVVEVPVVPVIEVKEKLEEGEVKEKKSYGYYDPIKSKAYRDKIRAAAIAGGHVFKEKGVGSGITVKKTSKTGKEYYYQPWSQLTDEQKKARLAAARERSAVEREQARKYKEEHPELFKKEESV